MAYRGSQCMWASALHCVAGVPEFGPVEADGNYLVVSSVCHFYADVSTFTSGARAPACVLRFLRDLRECNALRQAYPLIPDLLITLPGYGYKRGISVISMK